MQKKLINSQLSNFKTYEMYKRQLLTLAENVFEFENLPDFIDVAFLNKKLLRDGSIAFFTSYRGGNQLTVKYDHKVQAED